MKKEYILTNGTKYIRRNYEGQYQQITNISLAETFKTQQAAKNFMLNSLPANLSREYYVAKIEGGEVVRCNAPRPDKATRDRCAVVYSSQKDIHSSEWCKNFIGLDDVFKKALKRGAKVAQELSDIDLKVSDILHYIEFTALDVFSGYKAYKALRDLLIKRRCLKDEHKIINAINNNQVAAENISSILSVIEECRSKKYIPRKIPELFECGLDIAKEVL